MANNAVLLSKLTATTTTTNHHTRHPATTHRIHRLPPRLPSSNLRFTPSIRLPSSSNLRLTLSRSSLQTTTPIIIAESNSKSKSSSSVHDASPICWADSILKPLKRCAIPLVIIITLPLLLTSNPRCSRACSLVETVALACALNLSQPEPEPEPKPKRPMTTAEKVVATFLLLGCPMIWMLSQIRDDLIELEHEQGTTCVLKLQVRLLGQASPLQRGRALVDVASSEVKKCVLGGTSRALLCNPDYCISANSSVHVEEDIDEGIRKLHQLYKEEQEKFKEGQRHNPTSLGAGGCNNDHIVVTIMVAALGEHTIPTIKGRTDLINALHKLKSIRAWRIKDLKVVWTPQAANNTLQVENLLNPLNPVPPTLQFPRKYLVPVFLEPALKKGDMFINYLAKMV